MDVSEFADGEDPVRYVMDRVGTIYPVLYQEWADKQSDEALRAAQVRAKDDRA